MIITLGEFYAQTVFLAPPDLSATKGSDVWPSAERYEYEGGGAIEQSMVAYRLDRKVMVFGAIGDDVNGNRIRAFLAQYAGIATYGVITTQDSETGSGVVLLQKDRKIETYIVGANAYASGNGIGKALSQKNPILSVSGVCFPEELFARAREQTVVLSWRSDAPLPSPDVLDATTFLFMQRHDALAYGLAIGETFLSAVSIARKLSLQHDLTCIVDCGKEGLLITTPKSTERVTLAQPPAHISMHVLIGGFCAYLDQGLRWPIALRRGLLIASLYVRPENRFSSLTLDQVQNKFHLDLFQRDTANFSVI